VQIERLGFPGGRRVAPGGAAPAADVAHERELRNDEGLPAGLEKGTVHLPFRILKDPEVRDLVRQILGVLPRVASRHAKEHEEARTDPGDDPSVHRDRRL